MVHPPRCRISFTLHHPILANSPLHWFPPTRPDSRVPVACKEEKKSIGLSSSRLRSVQKNSLTTCRSTSSARRTCAGASLSLKRLLHAACSFSCTPGSCVFCPMQVPAWWLSANQQPGRYSILASAVPALVDHIAWDMYSALAALIRGAALCGICPAMRAERRVLCSGTNCGVYI